MRGLFQPPLGGCGVGVHRCAREPRRRHLVSPISCPPRDALALAQQLANKPAPRRGIRRPCPFRRAASVG